MAREVLWVLLDRETSVLTIVYLLKVIGPQDWGLGVFLVLPHVLTSFKP